MRSPSAILLGLVLLAFGGLALAQFWPAGETASPAIQYDTEKGSAAAEGTVNSPLRVVLRVPEQGRQPGDMLISVSLDLLDEAGNPAQLGGGRARGLPMRPASESGAWEYAGSVPSLPGAYHARLALQRATDQDAPQTMDFPEPTLRAIPDPGPALKSGFVFASEGDLWIRATDGSRERRLTYLAHNTETAGDPEWSPDGSLIAFVPLSSTASAQVPGTQLRTLRPDGTQAAQPASNGPREVLSRPAWSNDGRYLYFGVDTLPAEESSLGGSGVPNALDRRIDRVDLRTGERSTYAPGAQAPSTGGPRGDLLYLQDTPPPEVGGSPGQQLVRSSPGTAQHTILVGPGVYQRIHAARMSPDGKWVVFSATNGGPPQGQSPGPLGWLLFQPQVAHAHEIPWDLFILPSTGGEARRLTTLNEDQPYPAWLDNTTIAFMGAGGLYRLGIDDQGRPAGEPVRLRGGIKHGTLTWHGP